MDKNPKYMKHWKLLFKKKVNGIMPRDPVVIVEPGIDKIYNEMNMKFGLLLNFMHRCQ